MSVGVQAPYPQLGPGGTSKFIPEIWSGKILIKFYESTCLSEVTNNDYEGEIKDVGDKVWIRTVPNVTIRNYLKGQTLTTETPESPPIQLLIDRAKYFAVVVDDIDKAQNDVKLMDMYTSDASQRMKIVIEKEVFGGVYADIVAANKGANAGLESGSINMGTEASPVSITASNAVDKLLDAGNVLDEQNVPRDGRFALIPPWYARYLKSSDLKDASLTGDGKSTLRNGRVGVIDDMEVFITNNLAKITAGGNKWHCLVGTRHAITWAAQLTNVETLRAQTTFGHILRGLNVYGFKTIKGEAMVDLVASRG
jgi:hypothetical protein